MSVNNQKLFFNGFRDGIPIGLGYLAVAFSLGIMSHNAGMNAFQSFIASFLCLASAGEYAGFTVIAANAAYLEIAVITFIANARYLLMSFALSQRVEERETLKHRAFLSYIITDELFGITVAQSGYINPVYTYGAAAFSIPCWAIGTALGNIAGNIFPQILVNALSVSLFGMFLAIIIPPCKKNRIIAFIIPICFFMSYLFTKIPLISELTDGMRTIILTVFIASLASLIFPVGSEEEEK